jgi:hypothetical protein
MHVRGLDAHRSEAARDRLSVCAVVFEPPSELQGRLLNLDGVIAACLGTGSIPNETGRTH